MVPPAAAQRLNLFRRGGLLTGRGTTMKRAAVGLLPAALVASLLCSGSAFAAPGPSPEGRVRLLVQVRELPAAGKALAFAGGDAAVRHRFPALGAVAVEVPADEVAALRRQPGVVRVEPDLERQALGLEDGELPPALSNGLYGLITTKALTAHGRGNTGAGATVCVADTGLDAGHPDLAGSYAGGVDTVDGDDDPDLGPGQGVIHGTHVSGIMVGAVNGSGVRGVAPEARLHLARVLDDAGRGNSSDIMAGVLRLVDDFGCRVVNLSLGGAGNSETEASFYAGLAERGVLVVAAAGNSGARQVFFPAAYPGVLAVGALDAKNKHATFSHTGAGLDLSAPGVAVLSAVPRGASLEASIKTKKAQPTGAFEFSGSTDGTTGRLVNCGDGNSPEEFPPAVAGNIAYIRRGTTTFGSKVERAMDAGAIAVVIYNNVAGDINGTLGAPQASDGREWLPAVALSKTAGDGLRKWVGKAATVTSRRTSWRAISGTSMASPMVAGVAALLLGVRPELGAGELTDILQRTATDLGARGFDTTFGFGLVNADAAVKAAAAH
jgi:serine protease